MKLSGSKIKNLANVSTIEAGMFSVRTLNAVVLSVRI
jgi:hypothetical protein